MAFPRVTGAYSGAGPDGAGAMRPASRSTGNPANIPMRRAALSLLGRAVFIAWAIIAAGAGFLAGVNAQNATYNLAVYAVSLVAACAVAATILLRLRVTRRRSALWNYAMKNYPTAIGNCARRKNARAVCWRHKATSSCAGIVLAASLMPMTPSVPWRENHARH